MAKWVKRVAALVLFGLSCAVAWFVGFGLGVVLMVFGLDVPELTVGDLVGVGAGAFLVAFAVTVYRGQREH